MPELPEVEVVRRGLAAHVVGRVIDQVTVAHPRAVRRHPGGAADFAAGLAGAVPQRAQRRGKFLWLPLDGGERALVGHLGMSGQLLVMPSAAEAGPHLRLRFEFADGGHQLWFVDQRTFGTWALAAVDVTGLPVSLAHVAADPLDPAFDDDRFVADLRRRRTGVKRALLDQTLISGIGNIYADEALWRAGLHFARATRGLSRAAARELLGHVRQVFREAIDQGGTSFDSLYVNINGRSGYFGRSLNVYGRAGAPCRRCGTLIRRDPFMGRSSFTCPGCQPRPRRGSW